MPDPIKIIKQSDKSLKMPTTEEEFGKLSQQQQQEIAAGLQNFDCNTAADTQKDDPKSYYIACEDAGKGVKLAYLLGQVIVKGQQIDAREIVLVMKGAGDGAIAAVAFVLQRLAQVDVEGDHSQPAFRRCSARGTSADEERDGESRER